MRVSPGRINPIAASSSAAPVIACSHGDRSYIHWSGAGRLGGSTKWIAPVAVTNTANRTCRTHNSLFISVSSSCGNEQLSWSLSLRKLVRSCVAPAVSTDSGLWAKCWTSNASLLGFCEPLDDRYPEKDHIAHHQPAEDEGSDCEWQRQQYVAKQQRDQGDDRIDSNPRQHEQTSAMEASLIIFRHRNPPPGQMPILVLCPGYLCHNRLCRCTGRAVSPRLVACLYIVCQI